MRDNTYFYIEEADLFVFYKIPKELIKNEKYKNMKNDSKILYGLLLDRNSLSIKNKWIDEENKVYIYYTREEAQEDLNIGNKKVCDLFKELNQYGLIEEVRQGLNKANIIYVKKFIEQPAKQENIRTCENDTSRHVKNTYQEVRKSHANNTNINNTNIINKDIVGKPDSTQNLSLVENKKENEVAQEVITYLNEKTNKQFKTTTHKYTTLITGLLKNGYTIADLKKVIDTKCTWWLDDDRNNMYLRPTTLFGNKFDEYLNEQPKTKENKKEPWKNFNQTDKKEYLKDFQYANVRNVHTEVFRADMMKEFKKSENVNTDFFEELKSKLKK
jgi:uncharacterized phage protein (TIGR02220 family)